MVVDTGFRVVAESDEPGSGAVPRDRHHKDTGPGILRANRAIPAAAPLGPAGDPKTMAARRRRACVFREDLEPGTPTWMTRVQILHGSGPKSLSPWRGLP
jgi:hypothetical protein